MALADRLISIWENFTAGFGYAGGGWFPSGSTEGAPPFRRTISDSGQTVDAQSALQIAAVYACVALRARLIATLPIIFKQMGDNGKLAKNPLSRTYQMLAFKPNSEMTAADFWCVVVSSLDLWGNAYLKKVTMNGRTVSLVPLRPEYMTIYKTLAGEVRYAYAKGLPTQGVIAPQDYSSDEIIHIRGFTVDGLVGLSPIAQARQTLGRAMATDQASGKVFLNGMSASGYIKYEKALTKEQRDDIRAVINDFTGSNAAGKTMVLENGMTYAPININPVDAQMLETRLFNIDEVCSWWGVPPPLIGFMSKQSSWASSLENLLLGLIKFGIRPTTAIIEQAIVNGLGLNPANTMFRFDLEDLERGDSAAQTLLDSSRLQNGTRTRLELRERDGFEPTGQANEDMLTVQSNMIPLDKLGQTPPAPTPEAKPPEKTT
jgi:HK97 family phage portal protein